MQTKNNKTKQSETHPQFPELFRKQGEPNKWYYQVQRGDTIEKINESFFPYTAQEKEGLSKKTIEFIYRKPIDNREYWEPLFVGEELCILVESFIAIEVTELSVPYKESELSISFAEQSLLDLANPLDAVNNIRDLNRIYHYASQYMLQNSLDDDKNRNSLDMVAYFIQIIEDTAAARVS